MEGPAPFASNVRRRLLASGPGIVLSSIMMTSGALIALIKQQNLFQLHCFGVRESHAYAFRLPHVPLPTSSTHAFQVPRYRYVAQLPGRPVWPLRVGTKLSHPQHAHKQATGTPSPNPGRHPGPWG